MSTSTSPDAIRSSIAQSLCATAARMAGSTPTLLSRLHQARAAETTWREASSGVCRCLYLSTVHLWAKVLETDMCRLLCDSTLAAGSVLPDVDDLDTRVHRLVRALRARSGMAGIPMATALGWNQSTLSRLEAAGNPINIYRLHEFLHQVGWEPAAFWAVAVDMRIQPKEGDNADDRENAAGAGLSGSVGVELAGAVADSLAKG